MSEAQKKQIKSRLKNRLEKTYVLSFDTTASLFIEEEKVDAISGATDSWGVILPEGNNIRMSSRINWFKHRNFMGSAF